MKTERQQPPHLTHPGSRSHEAGFALIEVIVALVIMSIVGLMAWRGMDAMIRGRALIEQRANRDGENVQIVGQFERDCQEIIRRDELNAMFSAANVVGTPGVGLNLIAAGAKNIWWMRHYRIDNQDAWLIVGYGISATGLQRWTSKPLFRRTEIASQWLGISRDPDLNSSEYASSINVPTIVRQSFQVKTSIPVPGANNSTPGANTSVINPDSQGIVMQWWIKDTSLPMTRSCLIGGAL